MRLVLIFGDGARTADSFWGGVGSTLVSAAGEGMAKTTRQYAHLHVIRENGTGGPCQCHSNGRPSTRPSTSESNMAQAKPAISVDDVTLTETSPAPKPLDGRVRRVQTVAQRKLLDRLLAAAQRAIQWQPPGHCTVFTASRDDSLGLEYVPVVGIRYNCCHVPHGLLTFSVTPGKEMNTVEPRMCPDLPARMKVECKAAFNLLTKPYDDDECEQFWLTICEVLGSVTADDLKVPLAATK